MKKLFTILLLSIGFLAKAQTPIQYLGGPFTRIEIRGQSITDSIFWPTIRDTIFTPPFEGAITYRIADKQFYGYNNGGWHAFGKVSWGNITGSLTNQIDLIDSLNNRQFVLVNDYGIIASPHSVKVDTSVIKDSLYRIPGVDSIYLKTPQKTYAILDSAGGGAGTGTITGGGGLNPLFTNGVSGGNTITFTRINQNPNLVYAGPTNGAAAAPTFRNLVVADLPVGIPNTNLQNNNINFSIGTAGSSPNWASGSVVLGQTAILNLPIASATNTGILSAADWTTFFNKVTSVNGLTGVVVTKSADSIKKLPVDTSTNRNNYVLTFDSVNHKFFLAPGSGGGGCGACVIAIGALDGNGASANGASISGTTEYMQSASTTNPGLVNNTTQSMSGNKTFIGSFSLPGTTVKTPSSTDSAILRDASGKLWVYSRALTDSIFAINGLQALGTTGDSIGLGRPLDRNTSISGVNLYALQFDSFPAATGRGFRVNFGTTNAGWDLFTRDSATGYWTRIPKGAINQSLQMLPSGGIGWAAQQGAGTGITANNGDTLVGSTLQLGGSLNRVTQINITGSTYINLNATVTNTVPGVLYITSQGNGATGINIQATGTAATGITSIANNSGTGVQGISTGSGTGGVFITNTGIAERLQASGTGSIGLQISANDKVYQAFHLSTTNSTSVITTWESYRKVTGGIEGDAGIGQSMDFYISDSMPSSNPADVLANRITSKFTNTLSGSETSQFIIGGIGNGVFADLFTLSGSGALRLNKYGSGTFTGTATFALSVDASGNIIETTAGGGGGSGGGIGRDTIQTYTSGATLTQNASTNYIQVNPGSVQAALTITSLASGGTWHTSNDIYIVFGGTVTSGNPVITSFTFTAGSGLTLVDPAAPSGITVNAGSVFRYHRISTFLYRIP